MIGTKEPLSRRVDAPAAGVRNDCIWRAPALAGRAAGKGGGGGLRPRGERGASRVTPRSRGGRGGGPSPGNAVAVTPSAPTAGARTPPRGALRCAGFTLIELMVVLVILGLLAGLVGPQLFGRVDTSKVQTAETQIKMLRGALHAYRLDVGRFPSTSQGLAALVRPPGDAAEFWNGPYLDDEVPPDPWNAPYRYEYPADNLQGFALYSLGADSTEGGEGVDAEVGYLPAR